MVRLIVAARNGAKATKAASCRVARKSGRGYRARRSSGPQQQRQNGHDDVGDVELDGAALELAGDVGRPKAEHVQRPEDPILEQER